MIEFINGELVELGSDYVVVETGGLGYRLLIPSSTRDELGELDLGESVRLFTHLQVREDGFELYGFASAEERELFRLLLAVSGVGPRVALQVLSAMPPVRFRQVVLHGRTEELCQIRGIGRKTAERLILELKERLPQVPLGEEAAVVRSDSDEEEMAFQALTRSLGFSAAEARRALEKVKADHKGRLPTEEMIKRALELIRA